MSNGLPQIDPTALSLEESLLLSALLCGLTPGTPLIHRLQLFFCANFIVGKDNAEEDFQRSIETEVDRPSSTKYWLRADRGVYELTLSGYNRAKERFPNLSPLFPPAASIDKVTYILSGKYKGEDLSLERRGREFIATIGNRYFGSTKEACKHLGFVTEDMSAARILYNLAVRGKFKAA